MQDNEREIMAAIGKATLFVLVVAMIIIGMLSSGCTTLDYDPATGTIEYMSVLQKKSLNVKVGADGSKTIEYNTDSNAAVEVVKSQTALIQGLAEAYTGRTVTSAAATATGTN